MLSLYICSGHSGMRLFLVLYMTYHRLILLLVTALVVVVEVVVVAVAVMILFFFMLILFLFLFLFYFILTSSGGWVKTIPGKP